jgi:hypothetical protein
VTSGRRQQRRARQLASKPLTIVVLALRQADHIEEQLSAGAL